MRSRIIVVAIVCGVLGGIVAFAAGGDDAAGPSEIETLKKQLKALEQRVEILEARLGQGPSRRPVPMPPARFRDPHVPKDWLPREFNGRRYYIIPIDNEPNKASAPAK
jgi:hypothetical protein